MNAGSAPWPPGDGGARTRAIEHEGSVLVQAPAGSGKTTLLAQRHLRVLASVDAPERILALTFTRRAAHEMRDRVIDALKAARRAECPAAMNRRTWDLAAAANRHLDALDIDVGRNPQRLRIETIDAFNAWLAGQLPVTAGTGSRPSMPGNADHLYQEAGRRTLTYDEDDLFGRAVDRVLALDDQRWSRLLDLITGMLPGRDRWLPLLAGGLQVATALSESQLGRLRRLFDEDLALLVARGLGLAADALGQERLALLSRLMHAAAGRIAAAGPPDASPDLAAWRSDASVLRAAPADIARWRALVSLLLNKQGVIRSKLTRHQGFPPRCADKPVMSDLLAELGRTAEIGHALREIAILPEPFYSDDQWQRAREVAQVLMLAAANLDQVFRERGAADFPAVSMAALRALGNAAAPSELIMRLDYRLRHILIDEFQDTSSAQLELLRLLTSGWQPGDGRSVFCVGDPMQSIYGFRQAEVRAFLELAEEGIGDVRFDVERLSSNFRSAPPLVEWINATFSRLLPRADNRDRGAIAYRASESALPGGATDAGVWLRGFAARTEEARAVAATIAAQIALHPDWRVAVLVRAKSHAAEIAASLRELRVPFQAVDIEPLGDRAVVRDLISLTRALMHLGDRIAWLALLRAPWAGLALSDMLIIARAPAAVWDALQDDSVLARLSRSGRLRCERLRRVLQEALVARGHSTIARWIERTWLALGGPACCGDAADLEHAHVALARLGELEQEGMPDAARIGEAFEDLFVPGGSTAAVEIMTIHKAKGLEFDLVVLPGLDRHVPLHEDRFLLTHQFARDGRDGMVMAARPPVGSGEDRLFEFLRHQARDAAGLEAERLLYVGCTRAKSQLFLTATIGTRDDPAEEDSIIEAAADRWKPRSGSLLAVLWPGVGSAFEPAPARGGHMAAASPQAPRGGPISRLPLDWSAPIAAAAAATLPGADAAADGELRAHTPVFDWAGETARHVGTLVHAELQSLEPESADAKSIRARETHYRRWLEIRGVPRDRLLESAARATSALIAVLQDPRGRWRLNPGHRDTSREYAVTGIWRGVLVRAVFDRTFIDDQGVRWVIDYKTSRHAGGGREEFLDREVERYGAQMQRYAALARHLGPEPVRVGLYFPLLRAWREWRPED